MISVKEIPPRLNCQYCIMTSRTAYTHTQVNKWEILLRLWTRRQMLSSCAEPLKELMVENVASTFNGRSFSPSKQFYTTKLGRLTSSRETRLVTRETKRKSLEMAQTFNKVLVRRAIKRRRNSTAFGPDKLSIFHLKNFRPRAIGYITAVFNLSVTTCQIPAIWNSSLIILIAKPGKDTSVGTSYRPISLLCPAAKVLESLILPTSNKYLKSAPDQHSFKPDHSSTSALLQMTTDMLPTFE